MRRAAILEQTVARCVEALGDRADFEAIIGP